eukprot:55062-Prorocentrum_minimum.AAC.2
MEGEPSNAFSLRWRVYTVDTVEITKLKLESTAHSRPNGGHGQKKRVLTRLDTCYPEATCLEYYRFHETWATSPVTKRRDC